MTYYFSGGEKRQLEIRLCLQAVLNPNHDKHISGSNSNRVNVREGKTSCFPLSSPPTVYLFFCHATMAPPLTAGDMGVYGIAVLSFFEAVLWYHLALQYAVFILLAGDGIR